MKIAYVSFLFADAKSISEKKIDGPVFEAKRYHNFYITKKNLKKKRDINPQL